MHEPLKTLFYQSDTLMSPLTSTAAKGKIVFIEFNLFEDCILMLQVLLCCKKVTHLANLILRYLKSNYLQILQRK